MIYIARRGENIYKRKDGRWEGRYIKGRKSNGKIVYGYLYNRTYSILKKQLIHYKSMYQYEQNEIVYNRETVTSWMEQWMEKEVYLRVKKSTYASYKYKIKKYILPYVGKELLQNLSETSIQGWINHLINNQLSSATIRLIVQIFKMSLSVAKTNKLLKNNFMDNLILPKLKKRKIHALSNKEQKKLEITAFKNVKGASIVLSLYTGMRIGEISALKWSDIDFSKNLIHVQRTLQRVSLENDTCQTQIIVQDAKTSSSQRVIPFSIKLKQYLLWLKKKSKSIYVVATKEKALEPRAITYHFKKILKVAKLSNLHFHQLRHTFATRAIEIGGDITSVSRLLGHYSPKFTLEVYTDSLIHQRKRLTQKIERKFFNSF